MKDVSVIIPIRNEEKFLSDFIQNLYLIKPEKLSAEFIFVVGPCYDNTLNYLSNNLNKDKLDFSIIFNSIGTTPSSLNIGIAKATGKYIVRLDCHSLYPNGYIDRLIKVSLKYNCKNVGPILKTIPANKTLKSFAIASVMSSPFIVGPSSFRTESKSKKIIEVDTVPFGCFPREIFQELGNFDEELLRNQDDEFNARIKSNNGNVILDKSLVVEYYARSSFISLFNMFRQYGLYKPLSVIKVGSIYTFRQIIPLIAFISFILIIISSFLEITSFIIPLILLNTYLAYIIVASIISFRKNKIKLFNSKISLFITYFLISSVVIQSSYILGYLNGLFNILTNRKKFLDLPTSR